MNYDEAWKIQQTYEGKPHGWVQWKGTDVCLDVHCSCGELSHYDGSFCYQIKCPYCESVYFVNGHIELIQIDAPSEGHTELKVAEK